jgi:ribosome maturation factor RimP
MIHDLRQRIRTLLDPVVERLGFDLVAVEWLTDTKGPILRVSIDGPNGIRASDCARVSHHVSQVLDEADPIESSYRLEVSSPGIERPVQRLADFARFAGYRCKVRLHEGLRPRVTSEADSKNVPGRRFTGELGGVEGPDVKITVEGRDFLFTPDLVERAYLVLDLDEYQRLGAVAPNEPPESARESAPTAGAQRPTEDEP